MLQERSEIEPLSGPMFQEKICKPMKIVEVWQALMIKRYGAVAANSQALERLVDSLTQWAGLQSVYRSATAGVFLHGTSAEKQGIPECWLLKNEFDKCQAGGGATACQTPRVGVLRGGAGCSMCRHRAHPAVERDGSEVVPV